MAGDIVINRTAWKMFKIALEDAIDSADDGDKFEAVRKMIAEIEDQDSEAE